MGARVREAGQQPDKWRVATCPHCGQFYEEVNGPWLRWKRERAGISQRTMAKRLAISGPYLSDIERNRRDCPDSIFKAYERLK